MRRSKITQGAQLSGLMIQRFQLVQNEVIYMVRSPPKGGTDPDQIVHGPDYCSGHAYGLRQ